MKHLLEHADEIPVTLVVTLAYVTLAFLTDPMHPTEVQLERWGWLTPMLAADGQSWRLLSYAFLHGGILHLFLNLSTLLTIAPTLERSLGSVQFAVLYAVSAVAGGVGVCLVYEPASPVVGGSGALFGMLGALVAMNMRSGRHLLSFLDFEGPRRLLALIAANLVIGFFVPVVSNTGHIGGLLGGFAVTFLWFVPPRAPSQIHARWRLAATVCFFSLLFASVMPVTRFDWLHREAEHADAGRQAALRRAAAMAGTGRARVSDEEADRIARQIDAELAELARRRGG